MPGATSSTLVAFHAHPDDETILMGGTIARAAAEGHRVVLVFATRGDIGEVAEGFLETGEELATRRETEALESARILGVARVEFLGYRDSGMVDTDSTADVRSFWSADVDEAAAKLAAILREEDAAVLSVYDEHGNYGHPDHIQVHRVGVRAADLANNCRVYAATMNRDYFLTLMETWADALPEDFERPDPDDMQLGVPVAEITTTVDVVDYLETKRAAMVAHASQIGPESFFLALPDDAFRATFGTEWFIRLDTTPPVPESWIF